jgi:hypothetical protein
MKNVFAKSSSPLRKIFLVSLVAFGLMFLDNGTSWLSSVYRVADNMVRPLYWITNIPSRIQECNLPNDYRTTEHSPQTRESYPSWPVTAHVGTGGGKYAVTPVAQCNGATHG